MCRRRVLGHLVSAFCLQCIHFPSPTYTDAVYNVDMAIAWVECWKCELCGHRWIRSEGSTPPRLCAKCRKTGWHTATESPAHAYSDRNPVPVFTPAKPSMDALRAICAGDLPAAPEPTTTQPCTYTEYDYESGETYRCGLQQHSVKVKHTRGTKL